MKTFTPSSTNLLTMMKATERGAMDLKDDYTIKKN